MLQEEKQPEIYVPSNIVSDSTTLAINNEGNHSTLREPDQYASTTSILDWWLDYVAGYKIFKVSTGKNSK